MQTHTIRNKSKQTPIFTLTPAFFDKMLAARPESAALAWARTAALYKSLTGKQPVLDHEQMAALLAKAGVDEKGVGKGRYTTLPQPLFSVRQLFEAGFRMEPIGNLDFEQSLETAEAFYSLLDARNTADA